jgi:hypothetical protein
MTSLTGLNNGIGAMPLKDLTSDNNSTFSMSRRLFTKALIPPRTNEDAIGETVVQRESLGMSNNRVIIDGAKTPLQKKWIGGNRDASSMIARKKMVNTSNMSTGPQSFVNVVDPNTARQALIRTRAGGARVPIKVSMRP